MRSRWRYLVPNAITATSIALGLVSIQASLDGHYRSAAWWALYAAFTDKLDGFVARALKASSSFGGQLDSFADFLCFGVAPATLVYGFFRTTPGAGWTDGMRAAMLPALALTYVLCVASRLARFNLTVDSPGAGRFFFGVASTFGGGMLCALFVTLLKYGDPAWSAADPIGADWRLLDGARLDGAMRLLPLMLPATGLLMVSTLRVPKLGRTHRPGVDALQVANLVCGYSLGLARRVPEYLAVGALCYLLVSVYYHCTRPAARAARQPRLFGDEPEADEDPAGAGGSAGGGGALDGEEPRALEAAGRG